MNLEWIFIPYISAIQGMEFICVTLQNILNLMGWIFILQGDEMQGMILIQDEGMDFQPSNIWIFIQIFNNLRDNIFCHKGVNNRVCFSAWDRIKISYYYEMLLVGKFLVLKIELTVPSSGRYYYFQSEWEDKLHTSGLQILVFHPKKGDFSSVL